MFVAWVMCVVMYTDCLRPKLSASVIGWAGSYELQLTNHRQRTALVAETVHMALTHKILCGVWCIVAAHLETVWSVEIRPMKMRRGCSARLSTTAQYWLSLESLNFAMMPPTASTDPGPARPLWSSPQKPTIRYTGCHRCTCSWLSFGVILWESC